MAADPHPPKATSVRQDGEPDGFAIGAGWWAERGPEGVTRLIVSAPPDRLAAAHKALLGVLRSPLGFLYRQVIDRRNPRPEGAPPRDFVALEVPAAEVLAAFEASAGLVWHDARAEYWVRGADADQVVLDGDGLIYCYPDDVAFRDVLAGLLPEGKVGTMAERDYVRHAFLTEADPQEDALIAALGLVEVAPQKRG